MQNLEFRTKVFQKLGSIFWKNEKFHEEFHKLLISFKQDKIDTFGSFWAFWACVLPDSSFPIISSDISQVTHLKASA